MILGDVCTRSCTFCAVKTGRPPEYDEEEPIRVAQAIYLMQVKHAVITSVNRDELKDKGAEIWYQTVVSVKNLCPTTTIETLIPDVKADWSALDRMITGGQELVSHNLETVRSLYRRVRPQAKYDRSLEQIKRTKEAGLRTKSGIMLGLGETKDEVLVAMDDLRAHDCDVITLGQYLQPTKMHIEVAEGERNVPDHDSASAFDFRTPREGPEISAALSARKLGRLFILGFRTAGRLRTRRITSACSMVFL